MTQVKAGLIGLLVASLIINVVWRLLEPAVPYIAILIGLIFVYSFIFGRKSW